MFFHRVERYWHLETLLIAHPPFSFASVVRSHGWVQLEPFRLEEATGALSVVLRLDSGRLVECRLCEAPGGVRLESCVNHENEPLSNAEQEEILRKVRWMLDLDLDLSDFYALAQAEPKLERMVERAQGRVLRCPTLFEDVAKTILTTNTLWAATIRMNKNMIAQFGEPLDGDLSSLSARRAFPTPESLATSDEATLRAQTRLGYRAPYILELARSVASGALDLEALKDSSLPTAELRKRLLAIKGIGGYAAANLLMILGRYDFIPVDSWALKMVSHEWHAGQPVGKAEVEAAFERWGAWKGLAYWFWEWNP